MLLRPHISVCLWLQEHGRDLGWVFEFCFFLPLPPSCGACRCAPPCVVPMMLRKEPGLRAHAGQTLSTDVSYPGIVSPLMSAGLEQEPGAFPLCGTSQLLQRNTNARSSTAVFTETACDLESPNCTERLSWTPWIAFRCPLSISLPVPCWPT